MRFVAGTMLVAAALAVPGTAPGQNQPPPGDNTIIIPDERFSPPPASHVGLEAIVHRDTLFNGPLVSVTRSHPNLNLAWDVRSIRVRSGEWQICTGQNFTGRCMTIDRDQPTLSPQFRSIRSMRPTGGWGTGIGESLRGAASEFFPAPRRNGQRLQCQGGGGNSNCARQAANQFCRSIGWIVARTQTVETVGGRTYVADVLCARRVI